MYLGGGAVVKLLESPLSRILAGTAMMCPPAWSSNPSPFNHSLMVCFL